MEGCFHSVSAEQSYLQDAAFFCEHSKTWNQMMIDKFTTDIKRTKTLIYYFRFPRFHLQRWCKLGKRRLLVPPRSPTI